MRRLDGRHAAEQRGEALRIAAPQDRDQRSAASGQRADGLVVTDQAIRALAGRGGPLVAILWGRDAQSLAPLLGGVPTIQSAHPSPYSADRGFFGSHPFSRANALLEQAGGQPVDWKLP